jgi:hypothetical protein
VAGIGGDGAALLAAGGPRWPPSFGVCVSGWVVGWLGGWVVGWLGGFGGTDSTGSVTETSWVT